MASLTRLKLDNALSPTTLAIIGCRGPLNLPWQGIEGWLAVVRHHYLNCEAGIERFGGGPRGAHQAGQRSPTGVGPDTRHEILLPHSKPNHIIINYNFSFSFLHTHFKLIIKDPVASAARRVSIRSPPKSTSTSIAL